jgi:pimeloyl-ACP methyl ester carboxylesterase
MFDFSCFTYNWLWFTRPTEEPSPAPAGLERIWIPTPGGRIEVLAAIPPKSADADTDTKPSGPPIVFCHGGMGGAWVWTEYMTYLAQRGVRSYAVSLRGHGDSWYPSYLAMVFGTTRSALASDFVAAVKAVEEREGEKVLLVGHSSGGGLSQDILAKGLVTARGLALLGAVPCYGS